MSALGKLAHPDHKSAARVLGYALVSDGDPDIWFSASVVWSLRLGRSERAALAWAALKALHLEDVEPTLQAALGGAGEPLPWFVSPADEARTWAACASEREREAYCLATYLTMSPAARRDFLAYVGERAA